jgi:hypothetical protein
MISLFMLIAVPGTVSYCQTFERRKSALLLTLTIA